MKPTREILSLRPVAKMNQRQMMINGRIVSVPVPDFDKTSIKQHHAAKIKMFDMIKDTETADHILKMIRKVSS